MPMIDPQTGELSSAAFALDTTSAQAGEGSILEDASNLLTKALPLTGMSMVNSFANTAVDIGNFFGAGADRLSLSDEIHSYEDTTGTSGLSSYYQQHSGGIDLTALAVGSLVPGLAATKAFKLAQLGEESALLTRATGIFSGPRQALINNAEQELQLGDAALYGGLQADKVKAIAYGFGDQALQAVVYQAATIATMKASPLLDNESYGDIGNDFFYGALTGGGIGGLLEGIGTRALFNRALVNADVGTKGAELATYFGRLNLFPGDRMAELVNSVDSIQGPQTQLGAAKAKITNDQAILAMRNIIGTMVPKGSEDLGNSFVDTILRMKQAGNLNKDDLYQVLGRLAKIDRVDATAVEPTGDSFFVNKNVAGNQNAPAWQDIVSSSASKDADITRKFQLKDFSTDVSIAGATATKNAAGDVIPAYSSAEAAFADGHDIFINSKLQPIVNPKSANIDEVPLAGQSRILSQKEQLAYKTTGQLPAGARPLYGAPLILNAVTGGISSDVSQIAPVVGDFGKPKLLATGLQFGDKFSPQDLTSLITKDTSSLDANARYVWAAQRGIKAGDVINPSDVPILEALYRSGQKSELPFDKYISNLETRQKVSFSDGSALPTTLQALQDQIVAAKDELIRASAGTGSSAISADEIALKANVPVSYLQGQGSALNSPAAWSIDPAQHSAVNHLKLSYNITRLSQPNGQILRGMQDVAYRIQLGKSAAKDALAKLAGPQFTEALLARKTAADANIGGAGSTFLGASNANYGTLAQEMERIGSVMTQLTQARMAATSKVLAPVANAIRQDPQAAAELGAFRAVRQRSSASYSFLPPELAAKYGLGADTAVLTDSLKLDKLGNIVDWNKGHLPEGYVDGSQLSAANATGTVPKAGQYSYYQLSSKVAAFERAQQAINDERLNLRNNWYAAQGLNKEIRTGTLYTPPIDTRKVPFFAYVRGNIPGAMMGDDSVGVITAGSQQELRDKISALDSQLSVFTKDDIANFHKAQGDYEYDRNFSSNAANSSLQRAGTLNNVFPDTRAETIIKDYVDWNSRQELSLVRDHVELGNAQLFAELEAMGKRFTNTAASQTGFVSSFVRKTADNPYDSYLRTALSIGNKQNYPLWSYAQEKLEAFGDTAFTAARNAFGAAKRGLISYEEASQTMQKFGLGPVYEAAVNPLKAYTQIANKLPDARILSKITSVANSVLGTTVIRLDTFQQLIHILATPVLLTGEAQSTTAELRGLLTTELPDGSGRQIPAASKVMFKAVSNWFNKTVTDKWMPVYDKLGVNRDELTAHMNMIDKLSLPLGGKMGDVKDWIQGVTDKAASISGSNFSRSFIHFVAADTGRQIFEAAGLQGQELLDNIQTFAHRVQGNYVAAQRPVAFQGPIGQAVGLFQTYQFNLMQQVLRHIENGEAKTLASMAALHATVFGLQSLPGFQIINNHIIGDAAGNPGHADIFSGTADVAGKKLGDFLLYGAMSNVLGAGLYTRGDINPRQITLLPVNPLDYPAVRGAVRFVGSLVDATQKIAAGGSIPASLLIGLEHNGLSRPLSGLAQLAQGFSTTSQGSLIAATGTVAGASTRPTDNTMGYSDMFSVANFSRLFGARPLDEAIAMDAAYRSTLYKATDHSRIEQLGQAVKTTMYAGQQPSTSQVQEFSKEYAADGGNISAFGSHMIKWAQASNASVANGVFRSLSTNPANQNMMKIMGGQPLPDFINNGSTKAASTWAGDPQQVPESESSGQ